MKKISLIIGGSRGIGSIISLNFKKRGDKVFVISRKKIKSRKFNYIMCDITSKKEINNLKKKFTNKKIHNLVFSQRFRGEGESKDFKLMIQSTINLIKTLLNNLAKNSSIVFISSIATSTVLHDQSEEYHYTRGALETLCKYYACKLGKKKIRVNCIQPSKLIKPENKTYFSRIGKKDKRIIEKITPLGRIGKSEDVANLCNFLTSDLSTFITGSVIPVDGGLRLISQEGVYRL